MHRTLTVRLLRWALLAGLAVFPGLYMASALGAPLPHTWVVSHGDLLGLGMVLLLFQLGAWGERRLAAGEIDQLRSLAEENARLKAEAARSAEQVRELHEVEVRSLRLAFEELRREKLPRP
jgi:hypothetical protein